MKLWVDDVRLPPEGGWLHAESSESAIWLLKQMQNSSNIFSAMSLDHDLGGDDTTRPIVLWMCETDYWPIQIFVHTQNPVGREWLLGMIDRYKT